MKKIAGIFSASTGIAIAFILGIIIMCSFYLFLIIMTGFAMLWLLTKGVWYSIFKEKPNDR